MTDESTPTVDRWGFFEMDPDVYHADPAPRPSISSGHLANVINFTVAEAFQKHPRLAPPLTEAELKEKKEADRNKKYDLGTVAHTLVLGKGRNIVPIDAADWRTKAAQQERDEAFEQGKTPCLLKTFEKAERMRTALFEQLADIPDERETFMLEHGVSEMAGFAQIPTERGKMWGRSLNDWMTPEKLRIRDYKTWNGQRGADPDGFFKGLVDMGKDVQGPWYATIMAAILEQKSGENIAWDNIDFKFIVQDPDPPYLISVVAYREPEWSHARMQWAIDRWVAAAGAGLWRGFAPLTHLASPPGWAKNQWDLRMLREFEAEQELAELGRPALSLKDPDEYRIPDDMMKPSHDDD